MHCVIGIILYALFYMHCVISMVIVTMDIVTMVYTKQFSLHEQNVPF